MSEPLPVNVAALRLVPPSASVLDPDDGDDPEFIAAAARGRERAREARWHRAIPQRFHRVTVDFYSPAVRDALNEWAADTAGRNLVLFGPVGVGKTGAAIAACRRASDDGLEVRFCPVVEMLDMLRPGGPPDAFDAMIDVDRLIVDDLGSEKPTDWTGERLYALLNRRWLDQRPTIATTNLDPTALAAHIGERLYSRLVGNDAVCVRLTGPDRRRNQ